MIKTPAGWVATMRDGIEGGGAGYLTLRKCCCKVSARAGDMESTFCEPCLQVALKQCPPKKRFMRAAGYMKPRPMIVKPASSIALDRLVEVALSPTTLDLVDHGATKSSQYNSSTSKQYSEVGNLAGDCVSSIGVARSDWEGSAMGLGTCKKKAPLKQAAVVSSSVPDEAKLPRYSLPLEAVQKLKKLSSLDELPQSSRVVHGDHAKRLTPRFKSLLDISC